MKASWFFALLLPVTLNGAPAKSQISVGQAAPPLRLTQLLQAPSGARTDWPSLRGKVVVLEFWATWCSPCIEQIPHLNAIVRSAGSDRVQFIAVDDQPPDIVEKFVAKIPISGWLGIDTTGMTIRAFGAETRPKTVVVDRAGKIAGILNPTELTGDMLLSLAAGNKVRFPTDSNAESHRQALNDAVRLNGLATAGGDALFNISVRSGDPNGQISIVNDPGGADGAVKLDAINVPVQMLGSFMGLPLDRFRWETFPSDRYSLHVAARTGSLEQLGPAIQLAVANAANLKLVHRYSEEDVWVIQSTSKFSGLSQTTAARKRQLCMYESGTQKLILQQCSLDKISETLENYLRTPVLNETGAVGDVSAIIDLTVRGPEALKSALEENMGLKLVRARRTIERITIKPQ